MGQPNTGSDAMAASDLHEGAPHEADASNGGRRLEPERPADPWPAPPFLTLDWLNRFSSLTASDRRHLGERMNFKGAARRAEEFMPWLLTQLSDPETHQTIERVLSGDKARERAPRAKVCRKLIKLFASLDEEVMNDLRNPSGSIVLWHMVDAASVIMKRQPEFFRTTDPGRELMETAAALAWLVTMAWMGTGQEEEAIRVESSYLIGWSRIRPEWRTWVDRLLRHFDNQDWRQQSFGIGPEALVQLPETGLFDDAWLKHHLVDGDAGALALLGCLPEVAFEGVTPDGEALTRWCDLVRIGLRTPESLAAMIDVTEAAGGVGLNDLWSRQEELWREQGTFETIEFEDFSEDKAKNLGRIAWIMFLRDYGKWDDVNQLSADILIACADRLNLPLIKEAVDRLREHERLREAVWDKAVAGVQEKLVAEGVQSDTIPASPENSWQFFADALRAASADLSAPDLAAAEQLVTLSKNLRRAARDAVAFAEEERKSLGALLAHVAKVRSIAAFLAHDEVSSVRDAFSRIEDPRGWSEEVQGAVAQILLALDLVVKSDATLTAALDEQAKGGDPAQGKRHAFAVVNATRELEKTVADSKFLDLVQRYADACRAIPETDGVRPSPAVPAEPAALPETSSEIVESAPPEPVVEPAVAEPRIFEIPITSLPPQPVCVEARKIVEIQPVEAVIDTGEETIGVDEDEIDQLTIDAVKAWGTLMERDEPGLAWHLTNALEKIGRLPNALPRPAFLEALCYGRTVLVSGDASANEMGSRLAIEVKAPVNANEAMLAMAALIRPALLAPEAGAREYAIELNSGRAIFMHRLQRTLTKVQSAGVFLTAPSLRRPPADKDRAVRAEDAHKKLEAWFKQATQTRLSFQRALEVWKNLIRSKDGPIGAPVTAALNGNTSVAIAGMRAFIKGYNGDTTAIDMLIDRIDDEEKSGGKEPIIARARVRLRSMIQEACSVFEVWLQDAAQHEDSRGDEARIASLREEIEQAAKESAIGARDLARMSEDPVEKGAASALAESMDDILQAIHPTGRGLRERDPSGLLHDGFLRVPDVVFGGDRKPEPYDSGAIIEMLLTYAKPGPKLTWEDAFEARMMEHSHIATQRCLDILDARGIGDAEHEKYIARRDADIAQARHDLVRQRQELRRELDQALATDALRNAAISALLEEVEAIDPGRLPIDLTAAGIDAPIADFPAARRALAQVKRGLSKAFIDASGRISEHINQLKESGKLGPEDERRIRARLSKGDFTSASEMLELVEEGEGGFSRRAQRPFHSFFPAACDAIASDSETKLNKQVLVALDNGSKAGAFDFTDLSEAQARQDAARAIHEWLHLRSPQKPDKREPLKQVLGAVGFRNVEIRHPGAGDRKRMVFEVEAETIINQRICPIPRFGSMCAGHWRVSVWTGEATPDEIVNDVTKGGSAADLAVICSRLGVDVRRKLAQITRRDTKPVLVLDETLFGWLLTRSEYRLPMFFDCALPFTWCDPYPATEGPVAPESFYGRQEEIEKIIDPNGSCLVFGGRQLGKSAILAHCATLVNRPGEGMIAFRLDLKQIGADGRPETVWAAIGDELVRLRVLKNRHVTAQDLSDSILRWLEGDARKRLLLMLDEMDDFLVADGERGYENVVKMRALMDATQRRCKFVLAGLHNVQRASTTANTPLVHFGTAICVGPFDRGSDKAAARRMVIDPLAAAGYEFSDSWLALRILSHLNYYPSLAGVFCKQLAERMSKVAGSGMRAGAEGRASPLWFITAKDIEETMLGEEAQQKIKWRFDITLDLDPRYKLVALILAQKANQDFERGIAQVPVSMQEVRDEAMSWWPEGFAGRSGLEAFQALLEEMQGLGVLAKAGTGWKLRSSRIASMIGRGERIEAELITFRDRQPPPLKWEPGLDRTRLSGSYRRSPLNRLQEGDIAGLREGAEGGKDAKRVWIVFGSEAGGIEDVPEALERIDETVRLERFTERPEKVDAESFGWVLGRKASEGKSRLFWVGPQYAWTEAWVTQALQNAQARRAGIKVVFGGRELHALRWAARGRSFASELKLGIATALPVLSGALRFWLKDVGLEALDSVDNLPLIGSATGGFARNLETLANEISQQGAGELDDTIRAWLRRTETERMLTMLGIQSGMRPFLEEFASMAAALCREDMLALCELTDPHMMDGGKRVGLDPEAAMSWAEAMGLAFRSGGDSAGRPSVAQKPTTLQLKGTAGPAIPASMVSAANATRPEAWRPNPILARVLARAGIGAAAR